MLRIGLAGLGIHGTRYARHLLAGDVQGASLSAVSRRDSTAGESFAEEHGISFVPDPHDLPQHPDVDAVAVALLPDMHAAMVESCVAAGKPVLVDKPIATTAAEASRISLLVAKSDTPVMVGQTLRFDAVVQALLRESGSIGPVHMVSINQHFETDSRPWIDDRGRGGALLNTAVHGLDLLRYLTGAEPVSVMAECGKALTRQTEDILAVTVRLEPGGIIGHVENARMTDARSGRIEMVGEKAMLRGDHIHRTLARIIGRSEIDIGPVSDSYTLPRALNAFVKCLAEQTPFPITVTDGRVAVEMVEAARLSAETGRRIDMDEVR